MAQNDAQPAKTRAPGSEPPLADLYARAFTEFGARALWNMKQVDEPTPRDVLAAARQLRHEGNLAARRLAEQMEKAARAHL